MRRLPSPCIVCGVPAIGGRCAEHRRPDTRPSTKRRVSRAVSDRLRRLVLARDDWTCQQCGRFDRTGRSLEADHIVRLADDGEHTTRNMQTLCKPCHAAKTRAEAARDRGV